MSYSTEVPLVDSVHPTQPNTRVRRKISSNPDVYEWAVGKQPAYSAPTSSTDIEAILARVAALESSISVAAVSTPVFYSSVGITNAVNAGKAAYPTPSVNTEFYGIYTTSTGVPSITQLWKYLGIGINKTWVKVIDTDAAQLNSISTRLSTNETNISNLQTSIGNQTESNITVYYEDMYMADSLAIPVSISNINPAGEVNKPKRVLFKDFQCDFISNGSVWTRTACRPFDTSGNLAPTFPNSIAQVQRFIVEDVSYYGILREGGDITVSMLDTAKGKLNWHLAGQQFGMYHHDAIMHMAEEGSEWHLFRYTGYDIGGGTIGGSFTLTDPLATLTQLQTTPLNNPVFTERT